MSSRETRPTSERRTELSDRRDIVRRLLFVLLAIGGPAGLALALAGAARHRPGLLVAGVVLLVVAGLAWWRRAAWGVQATLAEIKSNPFKAPREPKE